MTQSDSGSTVKTTCGNPDCGKTDDHPKHSIHVGVAKAFGEPVYHPHDADKDGYVDYHFDCEHEWADALDPRTVEAAKSGVHGDELRALISGGVS